MRTVNMTYTPHPYEFISVAKQALEDPMLMKILSTGAHLHESKGVQNLGAQLFPDNAYRFNTETFIDNLFSCDESSESSSFELSIFLKHFDLNGEVTSDFNLSWSENDTTQLEELMSESKLEEMICEAQGEPGNFTLPSIYFQELAEKMQEKEGGYLFQLSAKRNEASFDYDIYFDLNQNSIFVNSVSQYEGVAGAVHYQASSFGLRAGEIENYSATTGYSLHSHYFPEHDYEWNVSIEGLCL